MKECVSVHFRFLISFLEKIIILPCCARDEFKDKSNLSCFPSNGKRIYKENMRRKKVLQTPSRVKSVTCARQ